MKDCDLGRKLLEMYKECENKIPFKNSKKFCNKSAMVFITNLITILHVSQEKIPIISTYIKGIKEWQRFIVEKLRRIRDREDKKIGDDPKSECPSSPEISAAEQEKQKLYIFKL